MEFTFLLGGIIVRDFFDLLEFLHETPLGDVNSGFMNLAVEERNQGKRQDAIESMHPNHLIFPMARWREADEIGILHVLEGLLDVVLAAITEDDLRICQISPIGEKDPLAQHTPLQNAIGLIVGPEFNPESPILASDIGPKKLSDILAGDGRIECLLDTFLGIRFPSPTRLVAYLEPFLKVAQGPELFCQMLPYATDLPLQKRLAASNENGAFLAKDLFLRAMDSQALEQRAFEVVKPFQRDIQQILMLGGNKGANEMVRGSIQGLDVLFGIVPFIENQGDAFTPFLEDLVPGNEIIEDAAESCGVVLVSFVGFREQGNVKIPRHEQGQTHDAKIGPFGLGVSPLSQPAGILRGEEGVKVGGVVKERPQVNVEFFDQAPRQVVLNGRQSRFVKVLHVIPEALTAQGKGTQRQKTAQDGVLVPGSELALAARREPTVKRGQEHVLADGSSLAPLVGVAVDHADHVQLLSDIPQSGAGSKVSLFGIERSPGGFGQAIEQLLSGAEVAEDADARAAVLIPIGFDDAPVSTSSDGVVLEARHDSYIPDPVWPVKRKHKILCGAIMSNIYGTSQAFRGHVGR